MPINFLMATVVIFQMLVHAARGKLATAGQHFPSVMQQEQTEGHCV